MKRLIFVIIISRFSFWMSYSLRHKRAAIPGCEVSLSSIREGFGCPSNKSEWDKRAQDMKCESFKQNCTGKNTFVYHCLINAWLNGTIEVCAPEKSIAGHYCAEFSKGGARVQAYYRSKCNSCPLIYKASESFKYQECYDMVIKQDLSTKSGSPEGVSFKMQTIFNGDAFFGEKTYNTNTTDKNDGHGGEVQQFKHRRFALILSIVMGILLLMVFVLSVPFVKRKRKQTPSGAVNLPHSKDSETGKSENQPFISSDQQESECTFSTDKNNKDEAKLLEFNKDFLDCLCKVEKEKPESLKEKIRQSPYYKKYANIEPKPDHEQTNVTGNFREDMSIQTAADVLDIKIYLVILKENNEKNIVCFHPKNPDAERWIKISLNVKRKYIYVSDCVKNHEETAHLTYDNIFV